MPVEEQVRWVPSSTAAAMLGVTRARVYQLIKRGALASRKFSNTLLVSVESIEGRQMRLEFEGVIEDGRG